MNVPQEISYAIASRLIARTACRQHTHREFGIAAAGQHTVLALPDVYVGVQQTAQMMEDDVLVGRLPIADGPTWHRPGKGVEVDEEKLQRYVEACRRDGQFLPN